MSAVLIIIIFNLKNSLRDIRLILHEGLINWKIFWKKILSFGI